MFSKEPNFCYCGCGEEVKLGKKYVYKHSRRGQKHTEKTKAKISIANKGKSLSEEHKTKISIANSGENNFMFGKHHTADTKARISSVQKGKVYSEETRKKLSEAGFKYYEEFPGIRSGENHPMFGKHHSEETKAKISLSKMGKHPSEETRVRMSLSHSGENCSEETRKKRSVAKIGEKCNWWQGGIAYDSYGPGNDEELKERIRIRDRHTCQNCSSVWVEGERLFSPHHIDYDKNNHVPWNRITLCNSCHSKTNTNREYWMDYLYGILGKNCVEKILSD